LEKFYVKEVNPHKTGDAKSEDSAGFVYCDWINDNYNNAYLFGCEIRGILTIPPA